MNTRSIHRLGCELLLRQLRRDGLGVEENPENPAIDFVVRSGSTCDKAPRIERLPILVRAASKSAFSISRKHERIHNLVLVYVWNVQDVKSAEAYAMTYPEVLHVAETMGWLKTVSWKSHGYYANNNP